MGRDGSGSSTHTNNTAIASVRIVDWKCSVCGEDADYSNNKIKFCHKHWWEKIQRGEIN